MSYELGEVAQLVAHRLCKAGVAGSSPVFSTRFPLHPLLRRPPRQPASAFPQGCSETLVTDQAVRDTLTSCELDRPTGGGFTEGLRGRWRGSGTDGDYLAGRSSTAATCRAPATPGTTRLSMKSRRPRAPYRRDACRDDEPSERWLAERRPRGLAHDHRAPGRCARPRPSDRHAVAPGQPRHEGDASVRGLPELGSYHLVGFG